MEAKAFIAKIAPFAVADYQESNVLPSLTISQAILESSWGESALTKASNNLFGIKGKGGGLWNTKEYLKGQWVTVKAEFAGYKDWGESIRAHSALLQKKRYQEVLTAKNYLQAVQRVYVAGYATDPKYPQKLQQIIERYNLQQYDIDAQLTKEGKDVEKIVSKFGKDQAEGFLKNNEAWVRASDLRKLGLIVKWDNKKKIVSIDKV